MQFLESNFFRKMKIFRITSNNRFELMAGEGVHELLNEI